MKYLSIDYGQKKVGLAISEGQIASLYKVIDIKGLKDGLEEIIKIIKEEKINRVVIGMPEGRMGRMVKRFSSLLRENVEVIEVDETLSSQNAKKLMVKLNVSKKERQKEDAYSAALILQNFLDSLE